MSFKLNGLLQNKVLTYNWSMREQNMSQTSFGHISINSLTILTVLIAPESPWEDLLIDINHVLRQLILAELLRKSVGNHHGTTY